MQGRGGGGGVADCARTCDRRSLSASWKGDLSRSARQIALLTHICRGRLKRAGAGGDSPSEPPPPPPRPPPPVPPPPPPLLAPSAEAGARAAWRRACARGGGLAEDGGESSASTEPFGSEAEAPTPAPAAAAPRGEGGGCRSSNSLRFRRRESAGHSPECSMGARQRNGERSLRCDADKAPKRSRTRKKRIYARARIHRTCRVRAIQRGRQVAQMRRGKEQGDVVRQQRSKKLTVRLRSDSCGLKLLICSRSSAADTLRAA